MDNVVNSYASQFWTIANVIVGFGVVNTLSFVMAVGPGGNALMVAIAKYRTFTVVSIIAATAVYVVLIGFCQFVSWRLRPPPQGSELATYLVWWNVIRLVAVAAVGLSCLPVALSASRDLQPSLSKS